MRFLALAARALAAFLCLVSASSLSESMPENSSSDSSTAVSASNSESSSKSSDSDSAYLIFFAAEARLGVFLDLGGGLDGQPSWGSLGRLDRGGLGLGLAENRGGGRRLLAGVAAFLTDLAA